MLDDVLVNFDAERAKAAAAVLRDFAAAGHQLLVFTCHEHILQAVQVAARAGQPAAEQRRAGRGRLAGAPRRREAETPATDSASRRKTAVQTQTSQPYEKEDLADDSCIEAAAEDERRVFGKTNEKEEDEDIEGESLWKANAKTAPTASTTMTPRRHEAGRLRRIGWSGNLSPDNHKDQLQAAKLLQRVLKACFEIAVSCPSPPGEG